MEIRSCRVTIAEIDGVAHASTSRLHPLSEAVALDLKQMQARMGCRHRATDGYSHRCGGERARRSRANRNGSSAAEPPGGSDEEENSARNSGPSCAKLIGAF